MAKLVIIFGISGYYWQKFYMGYEKKSMKKERPDGYSFQSATADP